ncbi:hypothetical protein PG994_008908, partial [Apiospora phragmitis]
MANRLVVVITGAGRGLGNCLAKSYLDRPDCIVVGTVRDESSPGVLALKSLAATSKSKLMIVKIESASADVDASSAVKQMESAGIHHIDILLANAGVSPAVDPLEKVSFAAVENTFRVNALGPLALYQACHPLLSKSKDPKFITISSAAGSLGAMENNGAWVAPSYSISKAALNWITFMVDSDMGNRTAAFLGLEKAPLTMAYSTGKIMKLIDSASRENHSGSFFNVTPQKMEAKEKNEDLCTELP